MGKIKLKNQTRIAEERAMEAVRKIKKPVKKEEEELKTPPAKNTQDQSEK